MRLTTSRCSALLSLPNSRLPTLTQRLVGAPRDRPAWSAPPRRSAAASGPPQMDGRLRHARGGLGRLERELLLLDELHHAQPAGRRQRGVTVLYPASEKVVSFATHSLSVGPELPHRVRNPRSEPPWAHHLDPVVDREPWVSCAITQFSPLDVRLRASRTVQRCGR